MPPSISHPYPMGLRLATVLALAALLGGCGERGVGGSGRRVEAPHGAGAPHLVLSGTPNQMGLWQGRLLRQEIHDSHRSRQGRLLGRGERGEALRSACLLYVDQALARMSESLRQELEGIAEGSGVAAEELLLTEIARDGVRFHDVPPGLVGSLACAAAGPEARCAFDGAIDAVLGGAPLLIERRPVEGNATLLVAWPGSLGGLAGVSCTGTGVLAVEVAAPKEHQTLGGAPFTVRLRHALEQGRGAADVVERLGGATAWRVLALDGPVGTRLLGLARVVGVTTADLSAVPFFALPPMDAAEEVVVPSATLPALPDVESAFGQAFPAHGPAWGIRWTRNAWHVQVGTRTPVRLDCGT